MNVEKEIDLLFYKSEILHINAQLLKYRALCILKRNNISDDNDAMVLRLKYSCIIGETVFIK